MNLVACIGAGNVGRAWAIVFARAGCEVTLYDSAAGAVEQHALPAIQQSLRDLAAAGWVDDAAPILARIHATDSLPSAVCGATYVQESVKEDLATKRAVFAQLGQHAPPETILASSTSAIPGSQFLDAAAQAERCLVAHPVNPPYLIPLVEVCPAPFTTPAVVDRCTEFLRRVGQQPILVRREVPGFILNRLQFTLVAEALHLVGEGYCEPDDIDKVLKHGLAMRWAFIGPFEVAHLNATGGFAGFIDNLGDMMRTLARDAKTDYNWGPELVAAIHHELAKKTPVEQIAPRQAWRDRRIMALRTHLADAADRLGE